MEMDFITQIGAGGTFVLLVLKIVLDYLKEKKQSEGKAANGYLTREQVLEMILKDAPYVNEKGEIWTRINANEEDIREMKSDLKDFRNDVNGDLKEIKNDIADIKIMLAKITKG